MSRVESIYNSISQETLVFLWKVNMAPHQNSIRSFNLDRIGAEALLCSPSARILSTPERLDSLGFFFGLNRKILIGLSANKVYLSVLINVMTVNVLLLYSANRLKSFKSLWMQGLWACVQTLDNLSWYNFVRSCFCVRIWASLLRLRCSMPVFWFRCPKWLMW